MCFKNIWFHYKETTDNHAQWGSLYYAKKKVCSVSLSTEIPDDDTYHSKSVESCGMEGKSPARWHVSTHTQLSDLVFSDHPNSAALISTKTRLCWPDSRQLQHKSKTPHVTSRNGTFKIIYWQWVEATMMIVLTRAAESNRHVLLAPCSLYHGPFHAPTEDLAMHRRQRCCCCMRLMMPARFFYRVRFITCCLIYPLLLRLPRSF